MSIQTNSPSTNLGTSVSADGIRATVTGTAGAGKPIVDDNAGGLEWGAPGGSPAIADITDWPSGLTATEIGYVNGVTSAIQTQLNAKQASATGTPDGSKFLGDDNSWKTVSASDSTKLALDGSNAMTERLQFSGTGTSAGASVANIFRNSAGALNYNVPTGQFHYFAVNGGSEVSLGASSVNLTNNATPDTTGYQLCGYSGGVTVTAPSAKAANLCSAGGGTTLPEVVVHGLSETAYAGAIEVKAGAVSYASNGTWTNCYSLAKGTHKGGFIINDSLGDGFAYYPISNTTIGTVTGLSTDPAYVNSGAEDATHIAFRVSGGYLQVNVGTSIPTIKLAITFQGTVV